jgi:TPR repeat protein
MDNLKPALAVAAILGLVVGVECWLVPGAFVRSDADYSEPVAQASPPQPRHGYTPEELTRLAQQGDAEAQWRLGMLYSNGDGVLQNDPVAVKWFQLSADQGYIPALNALANQHFVGRGVPQNYNQAYFWYDVALAKGDEAAASHLEMLNTELTQEEAARAHQQAQKWLREHAPTNGHP